MWDGDRGTSPAAKWSRNVSLQASSAEHWKSPATEEIGPFVPQGPNVK